MAAFWQTEEWWKQGDPPHHRLGVADLSRLYPQKSPSTWQNRRSRAKALFPELDWLSLSRGYHNQQLADGIDAGPQADTSSVDITKQVVLDAEIHRLHGRITVLQNKYDEALQENELEARLVGKLEKIVPMLAPVAAPTFAPRNPGRPEDVVALISDWHIGEVVSAEETGGLSHYDFDTFCRRWQYFIDGIGGICFGKLTGYDLPRLHGFMLGDMVTGIIHDELIESAEGTVMEWLIDGAHICSQGIRQLAAEFESVSLDCVVGNHGRMTKEKRFKKKYVNWDYLFYHFMRLELADQPNVTFNIHKSFFSVVEIANHRFLNMHGDNVRSWAGIPWYGIQRAAGNLTNLLASQRAWFDYMNLGHFHNAGTLDRVKGELVLNGSAVGGNEFSIGALFTSSEPKQVIYGVHPERGKTWEFKLNLSHGDTHECRFEK